MLVLWHLPLALTSLKKIDIWLKGLLGEVIPKTVCQSVLAWYEKMQGKC